MIDKGKYASHGVFIKKIDQNFVGNWSKPKNAVINPIPTTKPRQKPENEQQSKMNVQSRTFNAKFKFQEPLAQKPLPQDLIQPFLYIEKVVKKRKVDHQEENAGNEKKDDKKDHKDNEDEKDHKKPKPKHKPKVQPFITSKNPRKNTTISHPVSSVPAGYTNLYQLQTDKKNTANLIFQKMLESEIDNVKDMFNLWNKDPKRNLTADIHVKEEEFVAFVKELIPGKVTTKTIRHFFGLYRNRGAGKKGDKMGEHDENTGDISIRAFSYNYSKFKKAQTEITNIMSQKAAKTRYEALKKYIADFLAHYPELKIGMQGMKEYEETLRKHFKRLYQSYNNPFQQQIKDLTEQLQKPIIKYDREKKQKIEQKIQQYEEENSKIHSQLTDNYIRFMSAYQEAIVKNHDLLFTKRTVAYLLWPIIQKQPLLTRDLIEERVAERQDEKQRYLECLSDIVVEIDNDKKHLVEDCFTLSEIVQLVTMKFRNKRTKEDEELQVFTIESLKKLIKEIKRQYLLKNSLVVQDLDSFPADQQIPLTILHTCFQMQCTKILFKNRIWSQLLQMLPVRSLESRLHQRSIDANTCMEYLNKYLRKLDERLALERNKSKEVSLFVENAYNQNFGKYADIVNKIVFGLDHYVEGIPDEEEEEEMDKVGSKKKKVGFADVVESKLAVDRGQRNLLKPDQDTEVVRDIIKMIHMGAKGMDNNSHIVNNILDMHHQGSNVLGQGYNQGQGHEERAESPHKALENLQMLKSMARSYFEPEAMNTNAFDIRFYQKLAEQEKANKGPVEQVIELGTSMLLSGAPRPEQIQGAQTDPLRISRFLLKTIDTDVQKHQKTVQPKSYESNIYEGISNNYFKDKVKLENKPTRYDSEGKSKYSVLLPVGYYESYIVGQSVPDQEKWYLRPHHVETLTENPLSKKDNVISTEYQSKLEKLGAKKRPDQYVIEENVKRKSDLISQLQQRINALKKQVSHARRSPQIPGHKVPPKLVDNYYTKISEGKQDKQLQLAAYEGVLYDLRRKQRDLLNQYRNNESKWHGEPNQKWWERKDKEFNREARKDREIVGDASGVHRSYVQKLKNNEVY